MKTSDTSEQGLEAIIVASLVEEAGYARGDPRDYDREHAVDRAKLRQFLAATQPDTCETLGLDGEGPKHARFLRRLQGESPGAAWWMCCAPASGTARLR